MIFLLILWPFVLGVGKTTLCRKVYEVLKDKGLEIQGFYTEEVRNSPKGSRVGFDVITLNGQRGPLARVKGYVCLYATMVNMEFLIKLFFSLISK